MGEYRYTGDVRWLSKLRRTARRAFQSTLRLRLKLRSVLPAVWITLASVILLAGAEAALRLTKPGAKPSAIPKVSIGTYAAKYRANLSTSEFQTNDRGMRSAAIPMADDKCVLKVLLMGDHVLSDEAVSQTELAATAAQNALEKALGGPVWVGMGAGPNWHLDTMFNFGEQIDWAGADLIGFVFDSADMGSADDAARAHGQVIEATVTPFYLEAEIRATLASLQSSDELPSRRIVPSVLGRMILRASQTGKVFVFHHRSSRESGHAMAADAMPLPLSAQLALGDRLRAFVSARSIPFRDLGPVWRRTPSAFTGPLTLSDTGHRVLGLEIAQTMLADARRAASLKPMGCFERAGANLAGDYSLLRM